MVTSQILHVSIINTLLMCPKLQCSSLPYVGKPITEISWCFYEAFVFRNKPLDVVWRLLQTSYIPRAFGPPHTNCPLVSQQLLAIQEELNNKKSELEQAKEEQSHT